jgi:putative restriction endonuclease
MPWLEMSRDPEGRPAGWDVGECLWSPRRKDGGQRWGFWETMRSVLPGDVVFHLCGDSSSAAFGGHSVAKTGCIPIEEGPDGPAQLYRVELEGFTKFSPTVPLRPVFAKHNQQLREYFTRNRSRQTDKERLFYVVQSKRLQCLNGAYLSYLGDELLELLFGIHVTHAPAGVSAVAATANTRSQMGPAAERVGQEEFSDNVRTNWNKRCCFPGCDISDSRFLVGSHIARWADAPELRGNTSNGLCLCLVHDKAFELGAFTFDSQLRVVLGVKEPAEAWVRTILSAAAGQQLPTSQHPPSREALSKHWSRHGYKFDRTDKS